MEHNRTVAGNMGSEVDWGECRLDWVGRVELRKEGQRSRVGAALTCDVVLAKEPDDQFRLRRCCEGLSC